MTLVNFSKIHPGILEISRSQEMRTDVSKKYTLMLHKMMSQCIEVNDNLSPLSQSNEMEYREPTMKRWLLTVDRLEKIPR